MWRNLVVRLAAPLAGLSYGLAAGLLSISASADDTEIYFGYGQQDAASYVPNILFIMDTSGSMGNEVSDGVTRLDAVKQALTRLLQETDNVNVGLMRFTNPGGPVLYPVRNINAQAEPRFRAAVSGANDDAFQYVAQAIDTSQPRLGATSCSGCSYSGTLLSADDDREDGSADFDLGSFGSSDLAWRFHDLAIPQGANIVSAQLVHTINANDGADGAQVTVYAQAVDSAPPLDDTTVSDVSALARTSASISWDQPADNLALGDKIYSPDLSMLVQEVVDRPGWLPGNEITLIEMAGGGQIDICSWQQNGCDATGLPVLSVTWNTDDVTTTGGTASYSGFRFADVAIPQGATITEASLIVDSLVRPGMGSFTVQAESSDDAADYSSGDLQSRSGLTVSSGLWTPTVDSERADITSVVQEVVSRTGWCGGNALSLIMQGTGPSLITAFEGNPEQAAELSIRYEVGPGSGCQNSASVGESGQVRGHLIDTVAELTPGGYTPIVDTLYEAANYYLGLPVQHGKERGYYLDYAPYIGEEFLGQNESLQRRTRVSNPLSWTGGTLERDANCRDDDLSSEACRSERITGDAEYISPITDICQGNHIVLLSDGLANEPHFDSLLHGLIGTSSCSDNACAQDLAQALYDKSLGSSALQDYVITTHTIGFDSNSEVDNYLNQLSQNGGGQFYTASNADSLVEAFKTIIREAKDTDTTYVSPGVAVNQFNRLNHLDSLLFGLFKPDDRQYWPGNLKKYRFVDGKLVDADAQSAIDGNTGYFSETARSFWSTSTDGQNVELGGAAQLIPATGRKVYSNLGTGDSLQLVTDANTQPSDFGTPATGGDAEKIRRVNWLNGQDVANSSTEPRRQMGDPLHASPLVIDYGTTDHKLVVFVPTNEGLLHALEITNYGQSNESVTERFAFMPKTLLPNVPLNMANAPIINRRYGLDGDITLWQQNDSAKTKTLFFGMRRGGYNYYSLDVTDISAPKLNFVIRGGASGDSDFARLGQSWSQPVLTKVKIGSEVKQVLLFAGGYDTAQDTHITRQADSVGNAVFMVDAVTGQRLWWASNDAGDTQLATMTNSMPARLSVVDRNLDGLADHFYAVDTGGRVFRFDIYQGETGADLVKGGMLADLGDTSGALTAENRRFYHAPDIALLNSNGATYYAVAVGSGYRAHPLDTTTEDRFYLLKDRWAFELDSDNKRQFPASALTHNELYDATTYVGQFSNGMTQAEQDALQAKLDSLKAKDGWYLSLGTGEKVLASPAIIEQKIVFSTYVPAGQSPETICVPQEGSGRLYLLDLYTANAVADIDDSSGAIQADGAVDQHDRAVELLHGGIPPQPRLLFADPVTPALCIGTECYDAAIDNTVCNGVECLTENLLGALPRVRRDSWQAGVDPVPANLLE